MDLCVAVRWMWIDSWFKMSKDYCVIFIGIGFIEVGKRCGFALIISLGIGFEHINIATSITLTEKNTFYMNMTPFFKYDSHCSFCYITDIFANLLSSLFSLKIAKSMFHHHQWIFVLRRNINSIDIGLITRLLVRKMFLPNFYIIFIYMDTMTLE